MSNAERTNIFAEQTTFANQTFKNTINEVSNTSGGKIRFESCIFENPFAIANFNLAKLSFYNCKFSSYSIIQDSNIEILEFDLCEFPSIEKSSFIIHSVKSIFLKFNNFKGHELRINGKYNNLWVRDCEIISFKIKDINKEYLFTTPQIEFKKNNVIGKLEIECTSLFSDIKFEEGTYETIHLEGEFKNNISFKGLIKVENLFLESSTFNKRIDFEGGEYSHLCLYRSQFNGIVWLNGYDVLLNEDRDFSIKDFTIHECTFEKNISINVPEIEGISISNNNFKQLLNLNQNNDKKDADYLIHIRIDGVNQGNVVFENIYTDIVLGGINFGNINFKSINVQHLYINELQNKGVISFMNIKSGQVLIIANSILGNTDFTGSDVTLFKEFVFSDSNLDGINFSKHPFKILSYSSNPVHGYGIQDKSRWNANLKNIYNQLKKNASNKGDIDTAIKYQSLEYKYLLKEKNFGFDKSLLFLNLISNKNGLSWFRGVLFTLIAAYLFLLLYLNSINIEFNLKESFKDFIFFISSFPKLEIEKYSNIRASWQSSLIVWVSRIFISYGIYQTIAAFRKYGKS